VGLCSFTQTSLINSIAIIEPIVYNHAYVNKKGQNKMGERIDNIKTRWNKLVSNIKNVTPKIWLFVLTGAQASLAVVGFLATGKAEYPAKVAAVVVGAQAIMTTFKKFTQ